MFSLIVNIESLFREVRVTFSQFKALWDRVKRARNSIKGSFGNDSSQYKMVGGIRLSDRKPARRRSAE